MAGITINFADEAITAAISSVVGLIIGGVGTWLCGIPSRRAAARREAAAEQREAEERTARQKAEAELAAIQNRGDAPHFFVSNARFNCLYIESDQPGHALCYHVGGGNLLSFYREEVERDLAAGDPILLVVENRGQGAKSVQVKLDGEPVRFGVEADLQGTHGYQFFSYPYNPAIHGQTQTLEVRFEVISGAQRRHVYRTRHGVRCLTRIDPE